MGIVASKLCLFRLGCKRALIYEDMPNGSLEKVIHNNKSQETYDHLEWKTMHKIAIGVARGLEYLHCGCTTRIFHFDKKPHNILLGEDFCPKISDFGLAKLRPKKESIVSMLHRVSHKADVYSYVMLVLEMVWGRKNIGQSVEDTSDLYFPHSIYKKLKYDRDIGLHGIESEEDEKVARKMILVGLCCIQANPSERQAINKGMLMDCEIGPRISWSIGPDIKSKIQDPMRLSLALCGTSPANPILPRRIRRKRWWITLQQHNIICWYVHLVSNLPIITHTADFLQNLQHFFHRWPHIALILQTLKCQLSNHLDHLRHLIIGVKPKTRVNKLMKFMILNLINRHIRQINLMVMPCNVHSWLRRYKLYQNNSKTINVTLISKLVAFMVLGVHITRSTLWGGGYMGHISWEKMRKSKISNFKAKAVVEQDVVSFDIAVNDVRSMEVSQRASGFECNAYSCSTREGTGLCMVAMEVIGDSAIRDMMQTIATTTITPTAPSPALEEEKKKRKRPSENMLYTLQEIMDLATFN
ncbi:hypothetical protein HYC85_030695 [Camellia sinensis]|uniref:non-specific serine/threonine protein kinase n=1 Tax=Camellia sinensis TaxID=4442 RepID=A0A7J7G5A8_CAMSI|nr:hypothetical protein HYC85_030695 [Camellia sinensis]